MSLKRIIPCILLKDRKAVKDFNDNTVIEEHVISMVQHYNNNGSDELLIYNLATEDEEKEEALHFIKRIKKELSIPLIVGGGIDNLEDIKKTLYAGANKIVVSLSVPGADELLMDASSRFGKEKLVVSIQDFDTLFKHLRLIHNNSRELLLHDQLDINSVLNVCDNKCIVYSNQMNQDVMVSYLANEKIRGISGPMVSQREFGLFRFKNTCQEQNISVSTFACNIEFSSFKTDNQGLIPVVVQHYKTQNVLMLAYMNEEAFNRTIKTGKMTYYSRSRKTLWVKGETSGHVQYLKSLTVDCDNDTLLAKVEQVGAACHTGNPTCFYQNVTGEEKDESNPLRVFVELYNTILDRRKNPKEGSYTNYLFSKGIDKILKKVGEEATEIVIASKNPSPEEIKYEIADFLYHLSVLMVEKEITWKEITEELDER